MIDSTLELLNATSAIVLCYLVAFTWCMYPSFTYRLVFWLRLLALHLWAPPSFHNQNTWERKDSISRVSSEEIKYRYNQTQFKVWKCSSHITFAIKASRHFSYNQFINVLSKDVCFCPFPSSIALKND